MTDDASAPEESGKSSEMGEWHDSTVFSPEIFHQQEGFQQKLPASRRELGALSAGALVTLVLCIALQIFVFLHGWTLWSIAGSTLALVYSALSIVLLARSYFFRAAFMASADAFRVETVAQLSIGQYSSTLEAETLLIVARRYSVGLIAAGEAKKADDIMRGAVAIVKERVALESDNVP